MTKLNNMSIVSRHHLLRQGSSSKMQLKEKIVQIYEAFFEGHDISEGNPNFWDELFLLKVNVKFVEVECEKLTGQQLIRLKDKINQLLYKCIETLKEDHPIRVVNALQTLCAFLRGIFSKEMSDCGYDAIDILLGFENAESVLQSLLESLNGILLSDGAESLKNLALRTLLVFVSLTENVSHNSMLEYLMFTSVFESIIQMLTVSSQRLSHGHDAILLLTLILQYRKYESANPYVVKLSILDEELALNGYAHVVSSTLTDFTRKYKSMQSNREGSGILASTLSFMGKMFVAEEKTSGPIKANDSILLAMYEVIHLNRNFITSLTQSLTSANASTPPGSPKLSLPAIDATKQFSQVQVSSSGDPVSQPTNLLVTLLEYASIIVQNIKEKERYSNAKLSMIILTMITEDQFANSLMHDVNMNFQVPLHKMPMRHRKVLNDLNLPCRPLACALLDFVIEFINSHLMKNFPMELHIFSLGICHRLLCYQKRCRVRLNFPWRELWTALINLLKFILNHEAVLLQCGDILDLSVKIVGIFNLFITYGDTFLPSPASYDQLYYEIVRMHQVFSNLYSLSLRYTTNEGEWKSSGLKLSSSLVNVRAIINHFSPKVDTCMQAKKQSSLTEEQVLEVVRLNYDTLTLKLQDSLDQYERFSEKPKEMNFFTLLTRTIVSDVKENVSITNLEQNSILKEFSVIS